MSENTQTEKKTIPYKEMSFWQKERYTWFSNIPGDIWGGIVATFCLLPEVIGFMLAVGIPPYMGLFTCIVLTVTLSFVSGRPGVITACAGATATILTGLISKVFISGEHPEYLFAAVILAGIIQIVLGLVKFGVVVKFIPESVMHGFVNGLATIILISQIQMLLREEPETMGLQIGMIAIGVGSIVGFKFLKKVIKGRGFTTIPEAIIGVVVVAVIGICANLPIMRVADLGSVTPDFTYFGSVFANFGNIFTWDCFSTIFPLSLSVAFIGLVETMLTSRVVGEETNTTEITDLNRECRGQGIGNIICGFLGTMPGCAMIAPSTANVKSGGKGRLSSLVTGATMAVLLFALSPLLSSIPLAAFIGVMFYICFEVYNWDSIIKMAKQPIKDTIVMLLVVTIVIGTHNLAIGVIFGIAAYYIAFLLNFFVSSKKDVIVSFILLGVAIAIAPFGMGMFFSIPMVATAACIAEGCRMDFSSGKAAKASTVLNLIAFAAFVFLIILNTYIMPGAFIWYHL